MLRLYGLRESVLRDPFEPIFSVLCGRRSGADAQFSYESRQIAVTNACLTSNGVQGVAGSNPAVPMSHTCYCTTYGDFGRRFRFRGPV